MPVTPHVGRMLALELENSVENSASIGRAADALRLFADQLDHLLSMANDLSASVDTVLTDRLSLVGELQMAIEERDLYKVQLERIQHHASIYAED